MITGTVIRDEAIINLVVEGPTGIARTFEVVVDTGYSGYLSLPPSEVEALGLPFLRRSTATLSDGSETVFSEYKALLHWDGKERRIPIDGLDSTPLAGMALLSGHEFSAQIVEGGLVRITPLPNSR